MSGVNVLNSFATWDIWIPLMLLCAVHLNINLLCPIWADKKCNKMSKSWKIALPKPKLPA